MYSLESVLYDWKIKAQKEKIKTYIDVVFIVPHFDVMEESGFIQVHKWAWKDKKTINATTELKTIFFIEKQWLVMILWLNIIKTQGFLVLLTVIVYMFVDIFFCWEDLAHWSKKGLEQKYFRKKLGLINKHINTD